MVLGTKVQAARAFWKDTRLSMNSEAVFKLEAALPGVWHVALSNCGGTMEV